MTDTDIPTRSDILTDLSDESLARADRANLRSFARGSGLSSAMEYAELDGFVRWGCAHPFAWLNGVLAERDLRDGDVAEVDATLAWFRDKGTKAVSWWLEDGVERAGWERLLAERGFQALDGPPGLGADLAGLPDVLTLPAGAQVIRVRTLDELRSFAHLVNEVYGFPPDAEPAAYDWCVGLGLDGPMVSYLAYLDGRPVGTSAVYYAAGVPGIYNVCVEEAARSLGLGTALTLRPLLDARALGYRGAIVQSSGMGLPLYERLGFRRHGQLAHFVLEL